MLGATRATFGLIVGTRGPMLRFGERTKFWACAAGLTTVSAVSASAARQDRDSQLAAPCIMAPRYGMKMRRLLRLHGKADDLLALQLRHQARDLVLAHRLAAELQAEHAFPRAV